jgi:hypothetical protein
LLLLPVIRIVRPRAWAADPTPETWVAAQIRLLTAAELG